MTAFRIFLRLFAAFLIGWLVAWLNALSAFSAGAIVLFLFLPMLVGVAAALVSMDRRNWFFFLLAFLIGILVVAGWHLYWLPQAESADAACMYYPYRQYHDYGLFHCDSNTSFLQLSWVVSTILVVVSSQVACLIIHIRRIIHVRRDRAARLNVDHNG